MRTSKMPGGVNALAIDGSRHRITCHSIADASRQCAIG